MEYKGTVTIETPRLILRRFTLDDAPGMYENWATDPVTVKYLSWDIHRSVSDTTDFLSGLISCYDNPMTCNWVIQLKQTGEIIGNINLHSICDRDERVELGFCIGSRWFNRGYMTESIGAVIRFAFTVMGAHKIVADYDEENVASGKVMMKNKMIFEGRLRSHIRRKDGSYADILCYGLLRGEWESFSSR